MTAHRNKVLILPFTHSILSNPEGILSAIYQTTSRSIETCTILFSTPSKRKSGGHGLYEIIRLSPRRYWDSFQQFLGKIYGTMGAAQWASGKVLMDVEVLFEGMNLGMRFGGRGGDVKVSVLEAQEDLPILSELKEVIGDFSPEVISTPTRPDLESGFTIDEVTKVTKYSGYPTTALGGTFDHLHAAHKLLLHLSFFLTTHKLIVGIMTPSLLSSKSNSDLLEPLDERIHKVHSFLSRLQINSNEIDGDVELDVVEIHDPYGPTAFDPDIQALVVSRETASGGEAVNIKRKQGGLGELDIWIIDVIAAEPISSIGREDGKVGEEGIRTTDLSGEKDESKLKALKMGSTAIRQWIKDNDNPNHQ